MSFYAEDHQSTYEWDDLVEVLLDLGGERVCDTYPESGAELTNLVERGEAMWPSEREVAHRYMVASQCHSNAARLYNDEDEDALAIVPGYALSDDGMWRQHSWLVVTEELTLSAYLDENGEKHNQCDVSPGTLIETTVPREAYYGVVLTDAECDEFCFWNW